MNEFVNVSNNRNSKSFDRNQSLLSTVLWILSIICVCLTITNLYLIVWVWNNLSLTATNSIDLLSSSSHIRLNGQLRSKQALEAAQIRSPPEDDDLQDDSRPASTLSILSDRAIHLLGDNQQQQSKATRPYLSVWPQRQTIQMAADWSFHDASNGQTVMQCQQDDNCVCDLMADRFERLKLSNQKDKSVDFRHRSIQTGSVRARQVHSPTNRLVLRASGNQIRLRSHRNNTSIVSFDTLRLGHSTSAVSMFSRHANSNLHAQSNRLDSSPVLTE